MILKKVKLLKKYTLRRCPYPENVCQRKTMIGKCNPGTIAVCQSLRLSDTVKNFLGVFTIQGENPGCAPMLKIIQILDLKIDIIMICFFQIKVIGKPFFIINTAKSGRRNLCCRPFAMHNHIFVC